MRPDWSIHANWGFSMVDRQSNWSLISAVRHIWAPYHHDQCWVSLLPTAPGGVPSGGMEVLMMWWHSFLPSLTLSGPETTQRDQATKYRRTKNAKYKIPRWQQIQNTNYRAGNKYKIQSWQQNRTQITGLATNAKYKLQGWQQIQNTELARKPNWINHNPLALQPSFLSSLWSSTYILAKTICKINFAIYKYIWRKKTIQTTIKNKHDTIDCHIMSCSPNKLIKKVQKWQEISVKFSL